MSASDDGSEQEVPPIPPAPSGEMLLDDFFRATFRGKGGYTWAVGIFFSAMLALEATMADVIAVRYTDHGRYEEFVRVIAKRIPLGEKLEALREFARTDRRSADFGPIAKAAKRLVEHRNDVAHNRAYIEDDELHLIFEGKSHRRELTPIVDLRRWAGDAAGVDGEVRAFFFGSEYLPLADPDE